ncbi:MAG: NfeD family protein [Sphingorhabdus sp.]
MDQIANMEAYWIWLIVAAILAICELAIAPGIFLIFLAAAAAGVGIISWAVDISLTSQLVIFGILSIASVYLGRRWYRRSGVINSDPMLNDRSARMVGQPVTVIEDVSPNAGRARVGDSEWPARGPAMKAGTKARIAFVDGGILQLEEAE